MKADLEKCKEETLDKLAKMTELEGLPAWTQNNEFFRYEKDYWLKLYCNSQFLNDLQSHEVNRNIDEFDALNVMAMVRAFFQVAHKVSPFRQLFISEF